MTDINFGDAGAIITENLTDEVERQLVGKQNNLISQTIREAQDILREAAAVNEWDVEPVVDSLDLVETDRRGGTLAIRFGFTHPAAEYFEYGTSDHTIRGNPVLSFVWEERHDPPEWVREEFDRETSDGGRPGWRVYLPEVEVSGLPEVRFMRGALDFYESQLRGRGLDG
jgi:hypothetical protein